MRKMSAQEEQVLKQIKDLADSLGSDSYVGAAIRRAYDGLEGMDTEEPEEGQNVEAVSDESLRSVRLPSATVRQWEAERTGHSEN